MSALKQESDILDFDRFLDLDHAAFPSPSSSIAKGKAIATPEFRTPLSTISAPPPQNATPTFAGPSHQYDLHKQQTGIPLGALANVGAVPQRQALFAGGFSQGFHMNDYIPMNTSDDFNFNDMIDTTPSFPGSTEIDMDFDSPVDGMFGSSSGFVDPHALGSQEDSPPKEIVRVYPGVHSQQAALAKQQQQLEIQRQQQAKAAQPTQAPPSHKRNTSRPHNRAPVDPVTEERISRLLNQMRHSSVGSSNSDAPTPQANHNHVPKNKKDEEDMDEDERLLASEEGKKLSSKERRQLRNKVSARAFRSRRKGMCIY